MGRPGRKQDRLEAGTGIMGDAASFDLTAVLADVDRGMTPEVSYASAISSWHRQRYAQFFTPPKIARLMAEWALAGGAQTVLDPAVGMGALVRAALARKSDLQVAVIEKDPVILRAFLGTKPDLSRVEVILDDFLTMEFCSTFDAVLMNPPYLRHHDLSYDFDIFAEFSRKYGVQLSKLSNSYLLFTLKAAAMLNHDGRTAIIIPTEWMNANFGSAMKLFLIERGLLKEMIYFSNCSEIFDDALTTACVLLLEKSTP